MTTTTNRPTDPTEERLLEAVLAAPSDDGPRLVYADWLMERGDPRGELIVVQCTRESCERSGQRAQRASSAYRAACARERVLLAENVKQWVDPIGLRSWWGDFSRGFITRLTISPAGLRAKWSTFFARMPLEYIKLHSQRLRRLSRQAMVVETVMLRDISWLAAQPEANRLAVVAIETGDGIAELDWQALRPILVEAGLAVESGSESSKAPNPTLAWPAGCALPIAPLSEAVRAVTLTNATAGHISDLTLRLESDAMQALHVTSNGLDAADLTLLLFMRTLRNLRELSLRGLDDAAAARVLESNPRTPNRFPNLRKLVVAGRDRGGLSSNVARALCTNRILETIESLRVDVPLDELLIRTLDTKATQLKHLVVNGEAKDYAIDALARSPLMRRLETLSLVGAPGGSFGPPSIMPIMRADLTCLSSLSLENFLIGDANAQTIKNAPALRTLIELRLARCGLTNERARAIASSPYLGALTSINFQENGLSPTTVAELRARWPEALVHS